MIPMVCIMVCIVSSLTVSEPRMRGDDPGWTITDITDVT